VGLLLVATATLSSQGVGGAAVYAIGHAGAKSALFLIVGILLDRHHSVDEWELVGRGRGQPALAACYAVAAAALAGLPPFGTALGKSLCEEAVGTAWGSALFLGVSALTAGAALRAGIRCFTGFGGHHTEPPDDPAVGRTTRGDEQPDTWLRRTPASMYTAIGLLLTACLAAGVLPAVARGADIAARCFLDAGAAIEAPGWSVSGAGLGVVGCVVAIGVAVAGMYHRSPVVAAVTAPVLRVLRAAHSGHIGDYVAWLFAALAVLSAAVAMPLR
jgi:multicomponent Na+:H+ antiporter subunit D